MMNKKIMRVARVLAFIVVCTVALTAVAYAQTIHLDPPFAITDIETMLKKIVDWLVKVATPVAVIMVMVGAFQILTSGGSSEKLQQGKNTLLYTAIGYGIIFIGWGIVSIIESVLS